MTTLDVVSGGRAWLTIGAAWFEREHQGLGVHFPPLKERFERVEETIEIALQMWSDDNGPYKGKHYQLDETLCLPQPIQKPHPPIMIGGGGEKKTLRLVARFADACNLFGDPNEIRKKLDVLKRHCSDVGRDYEAIEKTRLATAFPGTDLVAECKGVQEAGIQHVIFNVPNVQDLELIRHFGSEVIPALS